MKAKISFTLLFLSIVFLSSSCTKTNTVIKAPTPSLMELLTGKQWIYDSVYTNYTGPNTGTVVYARGGASNTYMRDDARFVFWSDGYEDTFDAATPTAGYEVQKWEFINPADSTQLYYPVYNQIATPDYQRIIKLDATHLSLYDSTYLALDIFEYQP